MKYTVIIADRVKKQIRKLPRLDGFNILEKIEALSDNPRPSGCKKLQDIEGWRIRVGDYRVIYDIHDKRVEVTVIKIGHRKDIYN